MTSKCSPLCLRSLTSGTCTWEILLYLWWKQVANGLVANCQSGSTSVVLGPTGRYQALASQSQFLMVKAEAFSWMICRRSFYRALALLLLFIRKGANSSSAAVLRTCLLISPTGSCPCETINFLVSAWICHSGAELWASYMGSRYHLMLPALIWQQRISQKISRVGIDRWPPEKPFPNRCRLANGLTRHLLFVPFSPQQVKKNCFLTGKIGILKVWLT